MANHQNQIEATCKIKICKGDRLPDTYRNFIIARWTRSFRYGNDYMRLIDSDAYYKAYTKYIESLLQQPNTLVRIAILADTPDVAFGFAVTSKEVLHYVYVGLDYRRLGIGKLLVPGPISEFTHLTKTGLKLWPAKASKAKFNPFQIK